MDQVATHQRCLIAAAMRTAGPILELGCGWYSTPLLHEIAETQQRTLYTVDNNPDWIKQFMPLKSDFHRLQLVGWWNEMYQNPSNRSFGLCLVDHGQPAEREYAVRALSGRVEVFVLHDTEEGFAYGWDRLLGWKRYGIKPAYWDDRGLPEQGIFKYQWTDVCQKTWTTLASNTVDVTKLMRELPIVQPTQEIT